jgi:hypothetical protein
MPRRGTSPPCAESASLVLGARSCHAAFKYRIDHLGAHQPGGSCRIWRLTAVPLLVYRPQDDVGW